MPRQIQQLTYNSFSGGLITEASPLTFPDGASIDEQNFELTKQGFRKRRLGLEYIGGTADISTVAPPPSEISTYLWENVGTTGQTYLVVGVKNEVLIFNITDSLPGEKLVYKTMVDSSTEVLLRFTSNSGSLIIASGSGDITTVRALGDDLFSEGTRRLKVRDRVGIPDYVRNDSQSVEKVDLRTAERSPYRPTGSDMFLSGAVNSVSFNFTSSNTISTNESLPDGSVVTRTELFTSNTHDSFKGYPVESFIVESSTLSGVTTYNIRVVFADLFYSPTIPSTLNSGAITTTNGNTYVSSITEAEYSNFLSLALDLILTEQIKGYHPHIYNLWNQGWGESRMTASGSTSLVRPIANFLSTAGVYPSMADSVNYALYPDNNEESNRTADRFHPEDLQANPPGTLAAPRGKYIIDAMDRGTSRASNFLADINAKGESPIYDTSMNFESTSIGPQAVANYAGRVWYAGFAGDTPGSTIPLSNKVLYSQTDDGSLQNCYQEADPTSDLDSDLVDTDGGWVTIDGIDKIIDIVSVGTALLVFANNGVWSISGIDGNTFTPTASFVTKITEKGATNAQSIIIVDSDVYFWAEDGIYRLNSAGFAEFGIESLSKGSINDFVIGLDQDDLSNMAGAYDERLERIVWLVDLPDSGVRRELVFNILFGSFTINAYNNYYSEDGIDSDELLSVVKLPLFEPTAADVSVIAGNFNVLAGEDTVVVSSSTSPGALTRVAYIAINNSADGAKLGFASNLNEGFLDWGQVDATAYLLTGYISGGDTSRQKDVTRMTCHFNRTEGNATETGVETPSSCLVQSQWEWTNTATSNKWSKSFQAYRLPRPQISGIGEPVADGIEVVTTSNKIRGRGRVVSFLFSSEEGYDCQLLGWSVIAGANNNV